MTRVEVQRGGRVCCRAVFSLPMRASVAWGQLRDFRRFAAQDFFHAAVRVETGGVRQGARLRIDHRFGPFRVMRLGRILSWREGSGYSFSDLSAGGPRSGFPHVYRYRLSATGTNTCELEVTIAGLWTARWLPHWAVSAWLRWVFSHIAQSVRNELLATACLPAGPLVRSPGPQPRGIG